MKKVLLLLLCGCASPDAAYRAADRATYEAVAPEYREYVLADLTLNQADRDRRLLTISTWLQRIEGR